MTQVITDVAQVTPAWLTNVLHASGALDRGHVTTVHARPLDIPGSSTKLHLDVQYSADTPPSLPQHLFLKLSRPEIVDILPLAGQKEGDCVIDVCWLGQRQCGRMYVLRPIERILFLPFDPQSHGLSGA